MWRLVTGATTAMLGAALAVAGGFSAQRGPGPREQDPGTGRVVVVRMVKVGGEYRFSPATVTVHPGDRVRWVQVSDAPHNVQFDSWPKGAQLGRARSGPLLTLPGQRYEVAVDGSYPPGTYAYQCTPHAAMGMKGRIVVAPPGR